MFTETSRFKVYFLPNTGDFLAIFWCWQNTHYFKSYFSTVFNLFFKGRSNNLFNCFLIKYWILVSLCNGTVFIQTGFFSFFFPFSINSAYHIQELSAMSLIHSKLLLVWQIHWEWIFCMCFFERKIKGECEWFHWWCKKEHLRFTVKVLDHQE